MGEGHAEIIWCIYDILTFNNLVSHKRLVVEVIRCISDFSIFNNLVSRKRLVVERNRPTFEPRGQELSVYRILLAAKFLSSA